MRRALILSAAVLSALGADVAVAQTYLGWAGKPAGHPATTPTVVGAPTARGVATPGVIGRTVAPAERRPAAALPPAPPTPSPGAGLTPASAWLGARTTGPSPVATYAPTVVATAAPPAPVRASVAPAPAPSSLSSPTPSPAPSAASSAPASVATSASAVPDDPMAPRRDAPIFRLGRAAPAPQPAPESAAPLEPAAPATATGPTQAQTQAQPSANGGNRYYSVHRQAGRQPDAVAMPQPLYLDALPVDLTQPPAAQDLAEPGGPPTLIRNAEGRVQAMTPATDGDLP